MNKPKFESSTIRHVGNLRAGLRRPLQLSSILAGAAGLALAVAASSGCADEFKGSNVQIDFGAGIPAQDKPGIPLVAGHVPANAYFSLYAINEVKDEFGAITESSLFELQRFEIQPVLNLNSPCLIEEDRRAKYRGVHIFQFSNRIANDTGIDDITNPPPGSPEIDQVELATAVERVRRARLVGGQIKAITSASAATYPATGTLCADAPGFDSTLIPPANCADDASNNVRLLRCQDFWAANPDFYEGRDSILASPINGIYSGVVVGRNPINESGIGGSQFFVDEALGEFNAYAVYWQYDDANNDGEPDYPASVPAADRSPIGQLYMYGNARTITRGVQKVQLTSITNAAISATMAIFADLGEDNVHF